MTQRDFDPGYHREWDGPAVLLPLTAFDGGLEARGAIAMSQKTDAIANTIGIDTGKNTLHLIGLDHEGTIVLREKLGRGRIVARLANLPRCLIGIEAGMATHYGADRLDGLGAGPQLRSACDIGRGVSAGPQRQIDCRGLRVGLRRWRNGLAVAPVIW
jgi:hypothetical protein